MNTIPTLRAQIAPAILNLENRDPLAEGLNIVAGRAQLEYTLSNGFGFGGVNASVIFRRW